MAARLAKLPLGDQRREMRYRTLFRAWLRELKGTPFEVRITNLSTNGFCCLTSFDLNPAKSVFLRIPGLEALEAKVIWEDRFHIGCEFVRPLHPAVFDHVSKRFGFLS